MNNNIDWKNLGFHYTETDYMIRADYHNGSWTPARATRQKQITLHAAATCLQYGQEAFEGLKAVRGNDGIIRLFRPEGNIKRLQSSAEGLYMAPVPEDLFMEAALMAVRMNLKYVPPTETGAVLYLRPLLIGTTPRLGVGPGKDFTFIILASPIGPYYPVGFHGTPFIINRYVDRAAPLGIGQYKTGGNYAASFRATEPAHEQGLSCLFLDSKYKKYIDECGAANFFGIIKAEDADEEYNDLSGYTYITPKSTSILPSITNDSLRRLAKDMKMRVQCRHIAVSELAGMTECAACGTASIVSPISKIIDPDENRIYDFGEEPGPICTKLYNALLDIQYGRMPDKYHWCTIINQ